MFRKILFWTHLSCGVVAGLVVLMMSLTGVLLTYERQITSWADFRSYAPPDSVRDKLPIETLITAAAQTHPNFKPGAVQIFRDPGKPVVLSAGRSGQLFIDPYTAEVLGSGSESVRAFFDLVTGWHRWFNTEGENREIARAITGASNLMFLFLVLSGMYLWLPKIWNQASFRARLLFRGEYQTAKARDFTWHHVFGIWSAIPLVVIVASATIFYYGWANNLVYQVFGEQPPARGGGSANEQMVVTEEPNLAPLSINALLEKAGRQLDDWQSISIALPSRPGLTATFNLDQGDGGQPQLRHSLELDRYTGEVVKWEPFSSRSPGQQARSWLRFLHTGEAFGLLGQTIAGLVSFTSILLVWTGLALAYSRLVVPLLKRRSS